MQPILLRYLCSKMVGQQFTPEQRKFMVLSYHLTGSPSQTRQAFVERFPHRRPPDKRTIVRNFRKYQKHATNLNRSKGNSGRPKVASRVLMQFGLSRLRTLRPVLVETIFFISSFNRIVKFDLKFHPFRMII